MAQGQRIIPNAPSNGTDDGPIAPHDPDAERSLLGAMLTDPRAIATARVVTSPVDFYSPANAALYALLIELSDQRPGQRLDWHELAVEARRRAEANGRPPLITAVTIADAGAAASGYLAVPRLASHVAELKRRRDLLEVALGIAHAARTGQPGEVDEARVTLDALERDRLLAGNPYADIGLALEGNLEADEPVILRRTDGKALFYEAALNYVFGEPGKGKTWLALLAAAEQLADGATVVVVDYEDTLTGILGRLLALGVERDLLARNLHYVNDPASRRLADLRRLCIDPRADLVIADGIAAAMAAGELDENSSADTNTFLDGWLIPVARAGACVIGIDHVTKSKEQRGLWPRGSGAKRARIDGAAYSVEPGTDGLFTRSTDGSIRAVMAKDRRGIIGPEGKLVATLRIRHTDASRAAGRLPTYLNPPAALDDLVESGELDDPAVNQRVAFGILTVLEELAGDGPMSANKIGAALRGRLGIKASATAIPAALEWLRARNRIERTGGGSRTGFALVPEQRRLALNAEAEGDPGPTPPDDF